MTIHTHIKYTLIALICIFTFAGVLTLVGCQEEPISLGNQPTLPVEQNFTPPEKIWTEDDIRKVEVDPLDIDHLAISDYPPDDITAEDVKLINAHNAKRLQRLQAGRNGQSLNKE